MFPTTASYLSAYLASEGDAEGLDEILELILIDSLADSEDEGLPLAEGLEDSDADTETEGLKDSETDGDKDILADGEKERLELGLLDLELLSETEGLLEGDGDKEVGFT